MVPVCVVRFPHVLFNIKLEYRHAVLTAKSTGTACQKGVITAYDGKDTGDHPALL